MDATVAAAVWGWTWKSDCFDAGAKASQQSFIADHWGDADDPPPEPDQCDDGQIPISP